MDANTAYSYEFFFRRMGGERYRLVSREEEANVLLIDVDSLEGRRIIHQREFRDRPGQVTVVISANLSHPEQLLFLRKPNSSAALMEVLEAALTRLVTNAVAGRESSAGSVGQGGNPGTASQKERVASAAMALEDTRFNHYLFRHDGTRQGEGGTAIFDPDLYLYGAVARALALARQHRQGVEINWELSSLSLCGVTGRIDSGMIESVMRSVALTRMKPTLTLIGEAGKALPLARPEPVDKVLWRLAVWTSRGRLPMGIGQNARFRLARWPNLTRLLPTPHAMRISALWARGEYGAEETAQRLMISLADVYSFVAAVQSQGLLQVRATGAQTAALAEPSPSTPAGAREPAATPPETGANRKMGGLLSRILARILA